MSSYRRRFETLTVRDMKDLLNEDEDRILEELNSKFVSLKNFFHCRNYEEKDIMITLQLINKACKSKNLGGVAKLLNTVIKYKTFFHDCMSAIRLVTSGDHNIKPSELLNNYTFLISHIMKNLCLQNRERNESVYSFILEKLHEVQKILNQHSKSSKIRSAVLAIEETENQCATYENFLNVKAKDVHDFRQMSVFPQAEEVLGKSCNYPYLRENIIEGPYTDVEAYLSTHFNLMREDMVRTFRSSVKGIAEAGGENANRSCSGYVYKDVKVCFPPKYTVNGVFHQIVIKCKKAVNFSGGKRLLPGSLICLSSDDFSSVVFATIKKHNSIEGFTHECQISVAVEEGVCKFLEDKKYDVIETTAYFESYRHVLGVLKKFNVNNFPFADHIVHLEFDEYLPVFTNDCVFCLHEKCMGTKSCEDGERREEEEEEEAGTCKRFLSTDYEDWPTAEELKLDFYQFKAFQLALTHKVALIQGPPGTGKTFLGSKIVKAILENVPLKPVVICCVTNHALDQFLLRILDHTKRIVRLGLQSKSEELKPYRLDQMCQAVKTYRLEGIESVTACLLKEAYKNANELVPDIGELRSAPRSDDVYYDLLNCCDVLNKKLQDLDLCKSNFMRDSALNLILPLPFKRRLCPVAGSRADILAAQMRKWLSINKESEAMEVVKRKWNTLLSKGLLKQHEEGLQKQHEEVENIWGIPLANRFILFHKWWTYCLANLQWEIEEGDAKFWEKFELYEGPVDDDQLALLKNADIIGVTMTGAAKHYRLLSLVSPSIMMVEEAAESLESHLITSVVPSIKQLIMIGDHEQLRPIPASHELAAVYKMDISLFERLFKNAAPSATLVTQHRMRPCIANLLVPEIYKELDSHDSVFLYEAIKGVESNLFFFKHHNKEQAEGSSFSNKFEASFISHLVLYFLYQGYAESQITVLAMYAAQLPEIQKCLSELNTDACVHVTTVDNYQGEENDIIIISFVRSNDARIIGFLKESNRVCVALSRARKGLYCIGNFDILAERSSLWRSVAQKLVQEGMIGDSFPLKCPNHGVTVFSKSDADISNFMEKGCGNMCGFKLPCGHTCKKYCHSNDIDHSQYRCLEPCQKVITDYSEDVPQHVTCRRKCWEPCKVKKKKILLPCGHKVSVDMGSQLTKYECQTEVDKILKCGHVVKVPCCVKPDDFKCSKLISVLRLCGHKRNVLCSSRDKVNETACEQLVPIISPCGHTVEVPCCIDHDDEILLSYCTNPCDMLLDCGHACVGKCRYCSSLKIHPLCTSMCDVILPCGHFCTGTCGSPCLPCEEFCFYNCGHMKCTNPCTKPCVQCKKPCSRNCSHVSCSRPCYMQCEVQPCRERCTSVLDCGHQCIGLCGDPCPPLCKVCDSDVLPKSDCDAYVFLEDCEHIVDAGTLTSHVRKCITCFEWPSCPECSELITRSQRYSDELKLMKKKVRDMCDVSEELDEVQCMFHTLFGIDREPTWRFQGIQKQISDIFESGQPSSSMLVTLKGCLVCLKKLVSLEGVIDENSSAIEKFEALILWISDHLENASFQQLKELEASISSL